MTNSVSDGQFPSLVRRSWHGWTPLAITIGISAVLVALMLRTSSESPKRPNGREFTVPQIPPARTRVLPQPSMEEATLYSVALENGENGQVLRIRARPNGDELIIDAASGKLLAVCESTGKRVNWPLQQPVPITIPPTDS